ncbi:MAG TPA: hydrogenase formation protein HypD, partial [Nitrospirota bacterium]|nr:hydrogenase formation protein HypD [Nitrospirota bacterium]
MHHMTDELGNLMKAVNRPLKLMEVCGTHTVEIFRHGIRSVIPPEITLLSGPGCPVCVTSVRDVDAAIEIAKKPNVTLTTFGDMMRVPGGKESLLEARSLGADVRVLYSPLDVIALAKKEPHREFVFFGTGFETTSPLIAASIAQAEQLGLKNVSV